MNYKNANDVLLKMQDIVEFGNQKLESVNQRGIFGNTPLAVASGWGDLEAVRLLIGAGADVNAKVEDNDTALHRAVSFQHKDVIELLLSSGASTVELNVDGMSPIDLSKELGDDEIINLLLSSK
jgi:ankyrin repeat protein